MQNRFFLYLALLYVSLASISVQGIAIPRDLSPVAGSNLLSRALPANCALRVNTLTGKCGLTSNTRYVSSPFVWREFGLTLALSLEQVRSRLLLQLEWLLWESHECKILRDWVPVRCVIRCPRLLRS